MDNISTQLASLAITRSIILQRVANNLSKEVAQAYLSVIDDVTKQLKSGDDINIKNVNKIIKELQSRMEVNLDIESDLTKLGMSEAQWAQSSVNGAVGIDLMSKLPTEATIAKIVGDSYIQGATINEWFNGVNDSMKNDLKKSVRVGMLEGETTIQIAKRVRDSLGVSLNHADSISRTAVATVSNNARMATYEANDDVIKGYEHLSALDNRTSQVCATRDGATWDLEHKGINDKGKKFEFRKPPLHFRCRSLLSPLLKSYEELGLMGIDIPEGTRSSMDGQVSSSTTFERWFESKDSKFQEKYLGRQRYEMFKAGKITFNDLVGQNGMTLTIKELGMIDKGVVSLSDYVIVGENLPHYDKVVSTFSKLVGEGYVTQAKTIGAYSAKDMGRVPASGMYSNNTIKISPMAEIVKKSYIEDVNPLGNKYFIKKGNLPDNVNPIEYVTSHEFFHSITNIEETKKRGLSEFDKQARAIWEEYANDMTSNRMKYSSSDNFDEYKQFIIDNGMGSYAETNVNEFFAEAFAGYKTSNKPSKYELKVGELVDLFFKGKK